MAREFYLDRYRPRDEWFQHTPRGIHGLGHVARVLVWADRLLFETRARGEQVDAEAVRWAAAVHDLGRHDDGRDPGHGERSAAWLAANRTLLTPELTPDRAAIVEYCCRWHVPPDAHAPAMTAELRALKDADGLDRVRLGDLRPELLRSDQARSLVSAAEELFIRTVDPDHQDPWLRVRAAALGLGLWR